MSNELVATVQEPLPDDLEFEYRAIEKVEGEPSSGWSVQFDSGFSFFVPETSPVTPTINMMAQLYGKGFGFSVRGLVLHEILELKNVDDSTDPRYNRKGFSLGQHWVVFWWFL